MKCFIAIDEDLLLKIWMLDPTLVAPFSRTCIKHKPINKHTQHEIDEKLIELRKALTKI